MVLIACVTALGGGSVRDVLLGLEPDLQVVAEFGSGREALAGLPGRGVQVLPTNWVGNRGASTGACWRRSRRGCA